MQKQTLTDNREAQEFERKRFDYSIDLLPEDKKYSSLKKEREGMRETRRKKNNVSILQGMIHSCGTFHSVLFLKRFLLSLCVFPSCPLFSFDFTVILFHFKLRFSFFCFNSKCFFYQVLFIFLSENVLETGRKRNCLSFSWQRMSSTDEFESTLPISCLFLQPRKCFPRWHQQQSRQIEVDVQLLH